jgi:hypothetical protein
LSSDIEGPVAASMDKLKDGVLCLQIMIPIRVEDWRVPAQRSLSLCNVTAVHRFNRPCT